MFYQINSTAQLLVPGIPFGFALPEPVICPSATSRFWVSIYIPDTSQNMTFVGFAMFEETLSPYGFPSGWGFQYFCLEPGTLNDAYSDSTQGSCAAGYKAIAGLDISDGIRISVGGRANIDSNLIGFEYPRCYRRAMQRYLSSNRSNSEVYEIETKQGMIL